MPFREGDQKGNGVISSITISRERPSQTSMSPSPKAAAGGTTASSPKIIETLDLKDVIVLSLGLTIGGFYTFWNEGLHMGLYFFLGCVIVVGLGFIAASLCLAELTAALPFSGGMYGIVRLTAGPYAGYIVGWCEALQNILRTSCVIACASLHFSNALQISRIYEPVMWLVLLNISILSNARGGKWFWNLGILFTSCSVGLIVIFLLSTVLAGDLEGNMREDPSPENFTTNEALMFHLIKYFPRATWFFVGIEMVPLVISDCRAPKQTVPKAVFSCSIILYALAISTVIAICSLEQFNVNHILNDRMPLAHGFVNGLHVSHHTGAVMAGPGLFCTAYYFMYPFSRQVKSMAESNLLPSFLKYTGGPNNTPIAALAVGSLIVFFFIAITRIFETQGSIDYLAGISLLATSIVYIMMAYSYLVFHTRYYTLLQTDSIFLSKRWWIDLQGGKYAAYYVLFVFALILISLIGFYSPFSMIVWPFIVFLIVLTVNYVVNVSNQQCFSEEEQKKLMIAYVINRNLLKQRRDKERSLEIESLQTDMQLMKKSSSSAGGELEHSYQSNASNLFQQSYSFINHPPTTGAGVAGAPGTVTKVSPPLTQHYFYPQSYPPSHSHSHSHSHSPHLHPYTAGKIAAAGGTNGVVLKPQPHSHSHSQPHSAGGDGGVGGGRESGLFSFLGKSLRNSLRSSGSSSRSSHQSPGAGVGGVSRRDSSSVSNRNNNNSSHSHNAGKYFSTAKFPFSTSPSTNTATTASTSTTAIGASSSVSNAALSAPSLSTGVSKVGVMLSGGGDDDGGVNVGVNRTGGVGSENLTSIRSFHSSGTNSEKSNEKDREKDTIMKNHPIRLLHTIDRHGNPGTSASSSHSLSTSSSLLTRSFMHDHDLFIPHGMDIGMLMMPSPRSSQDTSLAPSPMAYQAMLAAAARANNHHQQHQLVGGALGKSARHLESVREVPNDLDMSMNMSTSMMAEKQAAAVATANATAIVSAGGTGDQTYSMSEDDYSGHGNGIAVDRASLNASLAAAYAANPNGGTISSMQTRSTSSKSLFQREAVMSLEDVDEERSFNGSMIGYDIEGGNGGVVGGEIQGVVRPKGQAAGNGGTGGGGGGLMSRLLNNRVLPL